MVRDPDGLLPDTKEVGPMRIPNIEFSRAQRRIVSTLTGLALALTVVQFSAARKNAPSQ